MEGDEIMADKKSKVNIDNKLFLNNYKVDTSFHIAIKDMSICFKCKDRICTAICPAKVYEWKDEHITVGYEGCLECGACRIACGQDNISWKFPRGGFGVQFRLA